VRVRTPANTHARVAYRTQLRTQSAQLSLRLRSGTFPIRTRTMQRLSPPVRCIACVPGHARTLRDMSVACFRRRARSAHVLCQVTADGAVLRSQTKPVSPSARALYAAPPRKWRTARGYAVSGGLTLGQLSVSTSMIGSTGHVRVKVFN